jgi:hypothetical protein
VQRGFDAEAVFAVINYLLTLIVSQPFQRFVISVVGEQISELYLQSGGLLDGNRSIKHTFKRAD